MKTEYITERVVNVRELQKLIENCFILAQFLQKESPHKESFEPLLDELKKARAFEFEIDIRKANYYDTEHKKDDLKEMLELVNSLGKEEIEFLKKVIEIKEREQESKVFEE